MKKKPNVVYILADDMGYGDISAFNENCGFQTPVLDDMCRCGMRFQDAHATAAVCTPSRYGLLTGRYNWRSCLKKGVTGGYSNSILDRGRPTLANLFRRNGYYTAAIGKWHLGLNLARNGSGIEVDRKDLQSLEDGIDYEKPIGNAPTAFGFDYFFGISASLDMPPYVYVENDRFTAVPDHFDHFQTPWPKGSPQPKNWYRDGPAAPGFDHEKVLDQLTDKVLSQIETHSDQPFFIYFPMPAPHGPIVPTKKFRGKSGINEYCDFVLECDDAVGRVRTKLKELGLEQNTIVVFAADNGCSPLANYPELLEKGHNPSYVFRGAKADIFEGGHRVPLIIQWPEAIAGGTCCSRTVCLSDFYATMAEVLGDTLGDAEAVDSFSNLSLWKNPDSAPVREYTVHQSINGSLAIRWQDFKLEMCPGSGGWSAPNDENAGDLPRFQLYRLSEDIGETANVIEKYPEVYRKLRNVLKSIVENGRSTPGPKQVNQGEAVWKTVRWMEETDTQTD